MASQTSALPDGSTLTKPAYTDSADIAVINTNMDKIVSNINAENQAIETLNSKKTIKVIDFSFTNVAVPATGSVNVVYDPPTISNYSRAFAFIQSVNGNGTGAVVMSLHGSGSGGSVFLSSGSGSPITANFTVRVVYVHNDHYENIT